MFSMIMLVLNALADEKSKSSSSSDDKSAKQPKKKSDPPRRAKPAPFDSIFPNTEYLGPTIGVANTDTIYPLNKILWKADPKLKEKNIRIYGWIDPSFNLSSSRNSNIPMTYAIVPNAVELDQLVLRVERPLDSVQQEHIDWGFRLTNLYGIDYRASTSQGFFSNQLLKHNNLYGYDPVEAYGQIYFPNIASGMVLTFGRYTASAGIESPLAPSNYLFTRSLMYAVNPTTQTGITSAFKLNDNWTLLLGLHAGNDMAPWGEGATPTLQALVRWVSNDNNDSLWGGINSLNDGKFRGNHDNLQQLDITWTHRFSERFLSLTEIYYLYQYDAAKGGTCNFGPIKSYGGGGGCGLIIPGLSSALGAQNMFVFKVTDKNFMTFRTDLLSDFQGQRTGFSTSYISLTLGLTHLFTSTFKVRPEIRYETAFHGTPYDNGTRKDQKMFAIDAILNF